MKPPARRLRHIYYDHEREYAQMLEVLAGASASIELLKLMEDEVFERVAARAAFARLATIHENVTARQTDWAAVEKRIANRM